VIGDLPNTDFVMNNVFWIGVYPGLTKPMLDFVAGAFAEFVLESTAGSGSVEAEAKLPVLP
jgi:CDP-6-deoxy-D-xylo-4-hexulose-3-dehydrase